MYKLTSFTSHVTSMGETLSFTYSEISDSGKVIETNKRESLVVLPNVNEENNAVLSAIDVIKEYLDNKLPAE